MNSCAKAKSGDLPFVDSLMIAGVSRPDDNVAKSRTDTRPIFGRETRSSARDQESSETQETGKPKPANPRETLHAQDHHCSRMPRRDSVFGTARLGSCRRWSDKRALEIQQCGPEPGARTKHQLHDHRIFVVFGEIVDAEALSGGCRISAAAAIGYIPNGRPWRTRRYVRCRRYRPRRCLSLN
jgi:hypothetical protein